MSVYHVRTDLSAKPVPRTDDIRYLDWAPGSDSASIDCLPGFFEGWRPSAEAADLFTLAGAVFTVDKLESRTDTPDAWTRDLELQIPVHDLDGFLAEPFAQALNFLSGDRWKSVPYQATVDPLETLGPIADSQDSLCDVNAVSLFSGGLDSLCGAVDYLERNPSHRLAVVSHYDGGNATSQQTPLFSTLKNTYGDRLVTRRLWLRPAHPRNGQEVRIFEPVETTTRARSFLFISVAVALASSIGPDVPVLVPENGYIAVNVPLTRARFGSASTRTTHPHFFALLNEALATAGVGNEVRNPYGLMTKGEMLSTSPNQPLLKRLAPVTVSCSHPEAARMQERPQGNCGYCFPCLIRRASLGVVGWDNEKPAWDALSDGDLIRDVTHKRGRDLRAVLSAVFADRPDLDLLRNAPLPEGTHRDHLGVWRRGNQELRKWLIDGAEGELAREVRRLK